MKKELLSLLLLSLFTTSYCFGQNLVPNPSFEDTVQCPVAKGIIENAVGWLTFGGTPDYYNPCNQYPASDFYFGCSVPSNNAGFQYPADGYAYAGLINAKDTGFLDREYLACRLLSPLQIGQKYHFCLKVSPGYRVPEANFLSLECFSNNIGIRFSTIQYSYNFPVSTDNFAHYFHQSVIYDTAGWTLLNGSFVADSAYVFLIVGNFFDDENTTVVCDSILQYSLSYLYVDDIKISADSNLCNEGTALPFISSDSFLTVYPNPASNVVFLKGNSHPIESYEILDGLANIRKSGRCNLLNECFINVADLPLGCYVIRIHTSSFSINRKVIINR